MDDVLNRKKESFVKAEKPVQNTANVCTGGSKHKKTLCMIPYYSSNNVPASCSNMVSIKYDQMVKLMDNAHGNETWKDILNNQVLLQKKRSDQMNNLKCYAEIGKRRFTGNITQKSIYSHKKTSGHYSLKRKHLFTTSFTTTSKGKCLNEQKMIPKSDNPINDFKLDKKAISFAEVPEKEKLSKTNLTVSSMYTVLQNLNLSNNMHNSEIEKDIPGGSNENLLDNNDDQVGPMNPLIDIELASEAASGSMTQENINIPLVVKISLHDSCTSCRKRYSSFRKYEEKTEKDLSRIATQKSLADLAHLIQTPAQAVSLETSRKKIKMLIHLHTSCFLPKNSEENPPASQQISKGSTSKGNALVSMSKPASFISKNKVETSQLASLPPFDKGLKKLESGSNDKIADFFEKKQSLRQRLQADLAESCASLLVLYILFMVQSFVTADLFLLTLSVFNFCIYWCFFLFVFECHRQITLLIVPISYIKISYTSLLAVGLQLEFICLIFFS